MNNIAGNNSPNSHYFDTNMREALSQIQESEISKFVQNFLDDFLDLLCSDNIKSIISSLARLNFKKLQNRLQVLKSNLDLKKKIIYTTSNCLSK